MGQDELTRWIHRSKVISF